MSKTLLYHPDRSSNFRTATHFEDVWDKHFARQAIDFDQVYDPNKYIITVNHLGIAENWYKTYIDQGFRVIVDNLWDNPVATTSTIDGQVLTLRAPNWAWFNEALWYIEKGYDQIQLTHTPDKFFLMPMRIKRPHRDQLLKAVDKFLNDSTYSYVSQGILLDGDQVINGDVEQRHINPAWFESTAFSLVAEAMVGGPTFMSEKTFKPMAFEHPFIVWGSVGTLTYLKNAGFETFDHVIDETYDSTINNADRLRNIVTVVDQLYTQFTQGKDLFGDVISREKIAHNRAHFYNKHLLTNMITQEVIEPILEFIQ
jgi:hypothetical protein